MDEAPRLGRPLDWRPARPPGASTLAGAVVRLEPLDPAAHGDALWTAGREEAIWDYLPYGPFAAREAFDGYVQALAAGGDPLAFAIVDGSSGAAHGIATYLRIDPGHGTVEIGHIWMGRALRRTRGATEAIFLLARNAFEELGYRRLEWKCNALNAASCRAAERFGFTFEGVFRQHQVVKGRNRDTAWFSITDGEWPGMKRAFEAWQAVARNEVKSCRPSRNAAPCAMASA